MVQRKLPITLVGAGLPQIAELAGDAKSYAERLFKFPAIDNLPPEDAKAALARPARDEDAEFTTDALDEVVAITGGYPYFIQELGYAVWTVADGPIINLADVRTAVPAYEAKLGASFFRVRLDRATDLQRAYLRAMAQLGPTAQKASDVADLMGRLSTNLGPTRAELINMGLLYTPEHGYASFTVLISTGSCCAPFQTWSSPNSEAAGAHSSPTRAVGPRRCMGLLPNGPHGVRLAVIR